MRWVGLNSKFLICVLCLNFFSNAHAVPWYQVKDAEDLEINIFFQKSSLEIRPVYNFHLTSMAKVLRRNSNLKLMIQHTGRNQLSYIRANKIKGYFARSESVDLGRIYVQQGLPSTNATSLGEKVSLFLKKAPYRNSKKKLDVEPKTEEPEIVSGEIPEPILLTDEGSAVETESTFFPFGERRINRLFNLGYRDYSFSDIKSFPGATADVELNYRVAENMFLGSEFGYAQLISGENTNGEYYFKLGFDVDFENIALKTRIYHLNNQLYHPTLLSFDTVSDYGLGQRIEFKLYKGRWGMLRLGFSGSVSFSNNLSSVDSANVFGHDTDLSLVIGKSRFRSSLYFSGRKYQVSGEGFDTQLWGFLLGVYF